MFINMAGKQIVYLEFSLEAPVSNLSEKEYKQHLDQLGTGNITTQETTHNSTHRWFRDPYISSILSTPCV